MSATALTPADMLISLRDGLESWATANKGKIQIASDPFHALDLLLQSPIGFRVVVWWDGDEPSTDIHQAGIVVNRLKVSIGYGRGLAKDPSTGLTTGRAGQKALYALISELRSKVRAIQFSDPTDEISSVWAAYRGTTGVVVPEGIAIDAYDLNFTLESVIAYEPETSDSSESSES